MPKDRFKTAAFALAAAVCAFYLLTLRQGQGWMDDYAQYVMHALNLAQGRPYSETGYVFNPLNQFIGPATYPPVFPLLLSAVCRLLGPDLQAMKALTVLFFAGFLYVAMLMFRGRLGPVRSLLAGAAVGLSPAFWNFKDYLYSEYPFLLFSFAALYVYGLAREGERAGRPRPALALAAGALTYLAYGTRTLGVLLPAAYLLADLARDRRLSRTFALSSAALLAPALLQNLTLHSDAVYAEQTRAWLAELPLWRVPLDNLLGYTPRFALLFNGAAWPAFGTALFALAALLAAAGFGAAEKKGLTLAGAYCAVNVLFLLASPASDGLRYAFQLVPFLFCYALLGWEALAPRLGRAARPAAALLLLSAAAAYAGGYRGARRTVPAGTEKAETRALFSFIRGAVPPGGLVVFRKPRTLALYTGRRSAMYHPASDAELLAWLKRTGAGHVVTGALFREDQVFLIPFAERNRAALKEIYSNPDFRVYRVAD